MTNGTCLQVASQTECDAQNGVFRGLGSVCGGDTDGDSFADACDSCPFDPTISTVADGACVPAVSQWGLVLTGILVAAGGAIVYRKRPRIAA